MTLAELEQFVLRLRARVRALEAYIRGMHGENMSPAEKARYDEWKQRLMPDE